jgi:hypothetical protein
MTAGNTNLPLNSCYTTISFDIRHIFVQKDDTTTPDLYTKTRSHKKGQHRISGKGKVRPRTDHKSPEGEYSPTLSLTSALNGVDVQRHVPAALPPGKTRYLSYRRLGGPQGRSGRTRKISPAPGIDPRTVQPVMSRCTNCTAPHYIRIP